METPKFVTDLLAEVATMDASAFSPAHTVAEGETVVGECSEYEKKLYSLQKSYSKLRDQHRVEAKYHTAEEGCANEHAARIEEYGAKAQILNTLLWACIDSRASFWGSTKTYGIRAGWVIISAERGPDDLPPGLRGIIAKFGLDE